MEEELNENDLEERLYSMLYYEDDTQENVSANQKDVLQLVENAPRSTVRRYWRTSEGNSPQIKASTPKEPPTKTTVTEKIDSTPKEEKRGVALSPPANLLSMFQSPVPHNLKKTVEIIENDEDFNVVELESSDEDEVVEVELPPKPTITIESSDEDEVCAVTDKIIKDTILAKKSNNERDVSASPVPSIVSSVSDEFIRGDCIALNISSRHSNNQSFDFSLHGSDLLVQTPSKKKKKKKNKEANTSTPVASTPTTNVSPVTDKEECFATPKSKAKNKRQRNKSYLVSEKSVPNADVYDSDSNQSASELNKKCESEAPSEPKKSKQTITVTPPEKLLFTDKQDDAITKTPKRNSFVVEPANIVDLTDTEQNASLSIDENIVMGNVTGLSEPEQHKDLTIPPNDDPKLGSTKVPAILFADLDFNNLNGKERVSKKRRYSLSTLRAEMEKFYNESWGGENFNHREIQKYMSRDKSLWVIDPKDRMSAFSKRKVTCNYCNRVGHREDTCRLKPPVCHMCGSIGHNEPRCPRKICVNCGSPNHMYSSMCRNCFNWQGTVCAECGQNGHPSSHCPDIWRRYHNTISEDMPLEENHQTKKHFQMFCSGCARRGHLVHSCRVSLPFSGLPINSPYVILYNPVYQPTNTTQNTEPTNILSTTNQQDHTITSASTPHRTDRNKRQSKSPVVHETHLNKKRNLSTDPADVPSNPKSPGDNGQKRKRSQSKDLVENAEGDNKESEKNNPNTVTATEAAPDFIPLFSSNRDKQGQMIQDNEVSDTSDVVTTARIYVTSEIMEKLNETEGIEWLNETSHKNNVTIQKTDINTHLNIKGTVGDQEAFQTELRDWIKTKLNGQLPKADNNAEDNPKIDQTLVNNIPKKRNDVLRIIKKALDSLNSDCGEPNALYKEFNYLQNQHNQLLNQKEISTKQLSNNRSNLNSISRKLNLILLGQAGLADGAKHLNELRSLLNKIINYKQKIIPPQLRMEVGLHYHSIFTCTPRTDYPDLLNKYYVSKKTPVFTINKKNDSFKLNKKKKEYPPVNQKWIKDVSFEPINADDANSKVQPPQRGVPIEKTVNKLVFYQRRLQNAHPMNIVLKKTRSLLLKKCYDYILMLNKNPFASPKTLRKMKKVQEEAQLFLTNV